MPWSCWFVLLLVTGHDSDEDKQKPKKRIAREGGENAEEDGIGMAGDDEDEEEDMMAAMGFAGFGSTKVIYVVPQRSGISFLCCYWCSVSYFLM